MAKYKVGDEVTVRGTVVRQMQHVGPIVEFRRQNEFHSAISFAVPIEEIATHTPKPREFKVGDKVYAKHEWKGIAFTVIAVHGCKAWIMDNGGYSIIYDMSRIRHADEAEQ